MRSFSFLAVVLLTLLGVAGLGGMRDTAAQDATPAEDDSEFRAGMVFQPLAIGSTELGELTLLRITIEPGAGSPIDAGSPEAALVYVESGTLTVWADVTLSVTRAGAFDLTASPEATDDEEQLLAPAEEIPAGQEVQLATGDSFLFPEDTAGELRNDGTEPTVLLVAVAATPQGPATPEA